MLWVTLAWLWLWWWPYRQGSSWAGWIQCCFALVYPGLSALARVCSLARREQGRLRCCWSCTAAPKSILLLFLDRIWRSWREICGSAFTLPGPRDTLSSGAQPAAPGGARGQGNVGRGWCGEGGMLVKRRGCPRAQLCVQHSSKGRGLMVGSELTDCMKNLLVEKEHHRAGKSHRHSQREGKKTPREKKGEGATEL